MSKVRAQANERAAYMQFVCATRETSICANEKSHGCMLLENGDLLLVVKLMGMEHLFVFILFFFCSWKLNTDLHTH